MTLLSGFASLALLLAVVGVYGLMSFVSQRRRREIAIRMALGALQKEVVWMIVRRGSLLSGIGVAMGTAGALATGRLLSSLLYGVTPSDLLTFIILSSLLLTAAMGDCYLPARRAAKVDPIDILRYE